MKKFSIILTAAAMVLLGSCQKEPQYPAQPDWSQFPDPNEQPDDGLMKPAPCTNNVVAHRGGSSEAKMPDNSIASLKYAMEHGCYASECDIYWTKDDKVVIAHADGSCCINGMHPWEHTLDELRAKGGLANGEQLPSLEDFIKTVMVEGNCTRIWLDIKNITSPSTLTQYPINATKAACKIITDMGAKHFVEFICTGNATVMKSAVEYARSADVPIGWMSNQQAIAYSQKGYNWANLAATHMSPVAGGAGERTIEEFEKEGIPLSVYNVDKNSGDGNAVYSDAAVNYYCTNYKRFKALCTNYPVWLINKIAEVNKTYDGINNLEELKAFAEDVKRDPDAKRFQNKDGEVVLHNDILVSGEWEGIDGFKGVLDGNGKTITFSTTTSQAKFGLFKLLSGYVKNLTIAGSIKITSATGEIQLGSLAAEISDGQVSNFTNKASLSFEAEETAKHLVIIGGVAGKTSNEVSFTNCTNEGAISIKSNMAYYNVGGITGVSAQDDKILTFTKCVNKGAITIDSANANTDWCYLGGISGKPQTSSMYTGNKYKAVFNGCENSGAIDIKASAKLRAGGIVGYIKACTSVTDCINNGATTISGAAYDRAIGGIIGFQETSSDSIVKGCTFGGSIVAKNSSGNHYFGGITTTGMSTATVIENCKTTKNALVDITGANGKSVGMIAGRPNTAITIKGCKAAGTLVDKDGNKTVISAANLEDWMIKGSATTAAVVLQDNGFNAE